jgi:DnaJ-class molecular chaperone
LGAVQKREMRNNLLFTVRCGPCDGTGQFDANAPCPVCKSRGFVLLPGGADDYMDCGGCAGSGFSGFDHHAICVRCQGVGAVRKGVRNKRPVMHT